jgi:hypothetical protein
MFHLCTGSLLFLFRSLRQHAADSAFVEGASHRILDCAKHSNEILPKPKPKPNLKVGTAAPALSHSNLRRLRGSCSVLRAVDNVWGGGSYCSCWSFYNF